jgi:hypothetical protein
MAVPTPPNPANPIPNSPFYYPETNVLQGTLGPFVIGSSLNVSVNGTIEAVGGGPAVTYLTGGPGIYVSANTGNVSLYNTGVLSVTAGTGIGITGSLGNFTITNTMPAFSLGGTVTQINTGDGLTGGPITTSGTIALSNTGVGAATYTNPTITVDEKGRITAASPGTSLTSISGTAPIVVTGSTNALISVNEGSPTVPGVVCVSGSVTSTCATVAASSQAVKTAYDVAQAALPCSVLVAQGDLITASTVGAPLRIAAGAEGTYLKVCASCVGTGGLTWSSVSGGSGTVTSITAGTGLTGGTITGTGTIALDTACVIAPSAFSGKGAILTATGAATPIALGSGSNGQVLTVNTLCSANLEWVTPSADIPCSAFNVKGDLLIGTGPASYCALGVGTNGQVLVADSGSTAGVCWGPGASDATPTLRGVLYGCSGTTTTGVGCNILTSLGAGLCNTAVGCSVLSSIVNGGSNTAVGYKAGSSVITNGSFNVAMGSLALGNATGTGNILRNTAIGTCSLAALTVGSCNVAVGACSMLSQTSGSNNVAVGSAALLNSTTGSGNVAIGLGSLLSNSTAEFNIGVGYASMQANTTGTCNIAVGMCAHDNLDGGCNNVALGFRAGLNLSTGCYNVSIGDSVSLASPTGSCQLTIGFSPTANWLTGDSTKAIKPGAGIIDCASSTGTAGQVLMSNGSNAICWGTAGGGSSIPCSCITDKGALVTGTAASTPTTLTVGTDGTFLVACSTATNGICWGDLPAATPAVRGVVFGRTCEFGGGSLSGSTALGSNALQYGSGATNTAIGFSAMNYTTTGTNNVAVGVGALSGSIDGFFAGTNTGSLNTAMGRDANTGNCTGNCNTTVGAYSMRCNNTGNLNTAVGYNALYCGSATCNNTAIGNDAGFITTGCNNTLVGNQAGGTGGTALTSGSFNVLIGNGVVPASPTASCQLAIGFSGTANWLTGTSTKAIKPGAGIIDCANSCGTAGQVLASNGANALCWTSLPGIATSTTLGTVYGQPGSSLGGIVSYGYGALGLGAGERMTAFGKNALPQVSEFACDNNAFGYNAFPNLTFGNRNTGIGGGSFGFGTTLTTGNNNTVIGNGADVAAAGSSNSITLGNSSITVIRAQVTTITALSDARDKTNVTALPVGLDFINSLNPVKFTWEMREPNEVKDGTSEAGFIAQDLQSAQAAADADYLGLVYDENPEKLEASAGKLIPVLVKAIQELSAKVEALEAKQSN